MKTVLIVLGAGASADVANNAAASSPEWRPPLARELFNVAARPSFGEWLNYYPGAKALAPELAELSTRETFSLERTLQSYATSTDARVRSHYLDIPRYLCSTIRACNSRYTSIPGSYVFLAKSLLTTGHEIVAINLNYDLLFEQALCLFDSALQFEEIEAYIARNRPARVYKVHGSINWFIPMIPVRVLGKVDFEPPTRPFVVQQKTDRLEQKKEWMPALVPPVVDKSSNDIICPRDHLDALMKELPKCTKTLFIGTSANERHILDLVRKGLGKNEAHHVVAFDDAGSVFERIGTSIPALKVSYAEAFSEGFREYLKGEGFERFLRL